MERDLAALLATGVTTITVYPALLPVAIGYGAMFAIAALYPEQRLWAMAGGNVVFTGTALYQWRSARAEARDQATVDGGR